MQAQKPPRERQAENLFNLVQGRRFSQGLLTPDEATKWKSFISQKLDGGFGKELEAAITNMNLYNRTPDQAIAKLEACLPNIRVWLDEALKKETFFATVRSNLQEFEGSITKSNASDDVLGAGLVLLQNGIGEARDYCLKEGINFNVLKYVLTDARIMENSGKINWENSIPKSHRAFLSRLLI